jgi:hypothetical protein
MIIKPATTEAPNHTSEVVRQGFWQELLVRFSSGLKCGRAKDGTRLSTVCRDDYGGLDHDAKILAAFLQRPLWTPR